MKYKNMREVSRGFPKNYKIPQKLVLRYDHPEYFK